MNLILIVIIAIVVLLLVFVMFAMDDQEDEMDFLQAEAEDKNNIPEGTKAVKTTEPSEIIPEKSVQKESIRRMESENTDMQGIGSEEDLRLRIQLEHKVPLPTSAEELEVVVAAIQLRCSEESVNGREGFFKLIARAESLFEKDFSFSFSCFKGSQLDRFWLFDKNADRDDELFEALVVAFEVISRFKKALESDKMLQEGKVRVAVGMSQGKLLRLNRGIAADPSWVGKPAYLAETLAEAAGDFSIYVDEQIHKAALPLFDFREWQPIKMRSPLPALPLFELVGWNKPSEIAGFASHQDASSRKAVAVAYRYLDLDNMIQPLLELLTDSDDKVALEALETLRVIGNEQALGLLKRIFPEARTPEFRSAIIDVFASIGSNEVVPVILGSCKEASWKVRLSAARALYKLSGKDSLRHLEHLLSDSDGAVRACVNSIFYKESGRKEYLENLSGLLHDLSARARKVAADELLGMDSDENLKIVTEGFADQETDLQKYILRKLENSKSKILYQCFLTLFKNSGEKIRPAIVESVRRAGLVS